MSISNVSIREPREQMCVYLRVGRQRGGNNNLEASRYMMWKAINIFVYKNQKKICDVEGKN